MDLEIWKCMVAYCVNQLEIDDVAEYVSVPKYILQKTAGFQKWDNTRSLVQSILGDKKNKLKKLLNSDNYKILLTAEKYENLSSQIAPINNLFPHSFITGELEQAQEFAVKSLEKWILTGEKTQNRSKSIKGKIESILGEFAVDENNKALVNDLMQSIKQLGSSQKKIQATTEGLFAQNTSISEVNSLLDEQTKRNSMGYEILANSNNNKLAEMEKRATILERIVFDQILQSFQTLQTLNDISSIMEYDREAVKVCSTTIGLLLRVFPQLQANYMKLTGVESFTNFHQTIAGLTSAGYRVFTPEQYAELENYVKGESMSEDEISKSNEEMLRGDYLQQLKGIDSSDSTDSTYEVEVKVNP